MPPKPASLIERLLSLRWIDSITGCWLPKIVSNKNDYFRITYEKKKQLIHRLSAIAFLGLNKHSSLQANHERHCPYKACYNPEHIYIGTAKENSQDYSESKTHCKNGHILDFENTYITILRHGSRKGQRIKNCRECGKLNSRRRRK